MSTSWPCSEWSTSGWYCTPAIFFAGHSNAATGAPADVAVTVKPSGALLTESPWLIHTLCSSKPSCSTPSVGSSFVRPYSRSPVAATVPPRALVIAWKP